VERLQRKFTTIHSTLAQQTSGSTPKVDSEPSLRGSQAPDQDLSAKVRHRTWFWNNTIGYMLTLFQ